MNWQPVITPNGVASESIATSIKLGLLALGVILWIMFKPLVMPNPYEIIISLPNLWFDGLQDALLTSFWTATQAILISSAISLPIAYLCRVPLVRPIADAISQLRFLSPAVFFLILLFIFGKPHLVKIGMLVLGETFFLVTSMVNTVLAIPDDAFDEAKVLRMDDWTAVWYVIVRGTLADAIKAIRDNAAIGWGMLTMVEGFLRSEGGIGVMVANQERYMHFDSVYGIALVVLLVGKGQDYLLRMLEAYACPHTTL